MITRRGRTVAVSTASGKIKWYANIQNRAGVPILADLNGDGVTDVLVASDLSNLTGHEGRSGTLIFGNEKGTATATETSGDGPVAYQTCAYLGNSGNSGATPFVVCNDPATGGLRADTLSPGK